VEKVEQVVRLIRSKGVSVWFITQNPSDLPDSVLGQIGNRIQHALRAYTPKDQKALRAAAQSFRANDAFDTGEALQALGVGEALVSVLDEKGIPTIVDRGGILPPRSSMSAATDEQIRAVIDASPLKAKYDTVEDRRSAYEVLNDEQEAEAKRAAEEAEQLAKEKERAAKEKERARRTTTSTRAASSRSRATTTTRKRQSALEKTVNSAANTVGRELGKQIVRGLMGNFFKK